jgi:phosphatidylinositol glycan class Q protein
MHAFSILTLAIFVAGYSTARWDLVTRVYELAIFAWDHGVITRAAKGVGLRISRRKRRIWSVVAFQLAVQTPADISSIHASRAAASLRASSSNVAGRSSGVQNGDMGKHMGLMRVFWPSDAPRNSLPGVLVGFCNSGSDVFVVGILQEVEVRILFTRTWQESD